MPSSYAFCRPFSCFDISLNLQRCKGGEQRPRPCLLSPTTPHTRQQKHRAERRRRRHPMLSLSCTSNKAIEAGPLAPPTIVGRLPRGWGMSPSYPFIPPLDLCVFVCRKFRFMRETNRTLLCEAGICMWVLCVSCVSVCDCGACVQTFGVGPVGVCASTLRRAIIHTHAPTLYLWLYHPTTAATTLEADTNTAVGIYILRPAYVQICECE